MGWRAAWWGGGQSGGIGQSSISVLGEVGGWSGGVEVEWSVVWWCRA